MFVQIIASQDLDESPVSSGVAQFIKIRIRAIIGDSVDPENKFYISLRSKLLRDRFFVESDFSTHQGGPCQSDTLSRTSSGLEFSYPALAHFGSAIGIFRSNRMRRSILRGEGPHRRSYSPEGVP